MSSPKNNRINISLEGYHLYKKYRTYFKYHNNRQLTIEGIAKPIFEPFKDNKRVATVPLSIETFIEYINRSIMVRYDDIADHKVKDNTIEKFVHNWYMANKRTDQYIRVMWDYFLSKNDDDHQPCQRLMMILFIPTSIWFTSNIVVPNIYKRYIYYPSHPILLPPFLSASQKYYKDHPDPDIISDKIIVPSQLKSNRRMYM